MMVKSHIYEDGGKIKYQWESDDDNDDGDDDDHHHHHH